MTKSDIKQMQQALRETVEPTIKVDGVLGNQTTVALEKFANAHGISVEEGKVLLQRYADLRFVSDAAFAEAAGLLAVRESYVRAIAQVESAGESFLKDGRVKILFERHWFYKKMREALSRADVRANVAIKLNLAIPTGANAGEALLEALCKSYPNICDPESGGYKGNEAEWPRLNLAMDFNIEAACQAASYGGYQLMGFNWKAAGFGSAKEMMLEMAKSESRQFLAAIKFIKANPSMHASLKRADWATFAMMYNGTGYKKNNYDTRLAAAESDWAKTTIV